MDKERCNLYLVGKPESKKYMSKRGGPSINDKCIYRLVDELKKKGIEVNLESSEASYVEPVSRFNSEEKRGKCCIADDKDLKERYFYLNYSLKTRGFEIFLEDISEKDIEGIRCHLGFDGMSEEAEKKIFDDVKVVLTRFYGFECRDTK